MGVDRGYKGDKAGQGFGREKARRKRCPDCGKKGVFGPHATAYGPLRECQFCRATWGSDLAWNIANQTVNAQSRTAASTTFARYPKRET